MKTIFGAIAISAALLAAPSQAREREFYIAVEGGLSLSDEADVDFEQTNQGGVQPQAASAQIEAGLDVDAVIGYDFGVLRVELEAGYKRVGSDDVTIFTSRLVDNTNGVTGVNTFTNPENVTAKSAMVNALVDFGDDDDFQVYAGFGLGVANVDIPITYPGVAPIIEEDTTDLALQAIAGFRLPVSDRVDIGLKYRFFAVDEFEYVSAFGDTLEVDYETHSLMASVMFNLGRASRQ